MPIKSPLQSVQCLSIMSCSSEYSELSKVINSLKAFFLSKSIKIIYDHKFLSKELQKNNIDFNINFFDVKIANYLIDSSRREKHNAVIDCELLSRVYINLLDQKEPKLNFNNQNEKIKNESGKRVSVYSKKVIIPSAEEIKNHKEFLKKDLEKNLF